jgi:hypothetical protein
LCKLEMVTSREATGETKVTGSLCSLIWWNSHGLTASGMKVSPGTFSSVLILCGGKKEMTYVSLHLFDLCWRAWLPNSFSRDGEQMQQGESHP